MWPQECKQNWKSEVWERQLYTVRFGHADVRTHEKSASFYPIFTHLTRCTRQNHRRNLTCDYNFPFRRPAGRGKVKFPFRPSVPKENRLRHRTKATGTEKPTRRTEKEEMCFRSRLWKERTHLTPTWRNEQSLTNVTWHLEPFSSRHVEILCPLRYGRYRNDERGVRSGADTNLIRPRDDPQLGGESGSQGLVKVISFSTVERAIFVLVV